MDFLGTASETQLSLMAFIKSYTMSSYRIRKTLKLKINVTDKITTSVIPNVLRFKKHDQRTVIMLEILSV